MTASTIATQEATPRQLKIAGAMAVALLALTVTTFVNADRPGPQIISFLPAFLTLVIATDGLTAVLLLSQARIGRDRGLCVLAGAYIFAAAMAVGQFVTFPGLLSEPGLLGGPQSAVWLWIVWHGGYPLFLLAYAAIKGSRFETADLMSLMRFRARLLLGLAVVIGVILLVIIHYASALPVVVSKGSYSALMTSGVGPVIWVFNLLALVLVVFRTRLTSVGAIWVTIAVLAALLDVSETLIAGSRFAIGWYIARLNSVLSSSTILVVLMIKVIQLFAQSSEANESLAEAKKIADTALAARTNFLASMAHEIRTPMNGVISVATLLDQTRLTQDQRHLLGVVRSSANALLSIIGDLLDFSKIEAGQLDIERIGFSLVDTVEGTVELMAGRAEERGTTLILDIDPTLPDGLIGDPTRVRQILLNLLGNAVKFTERGSVTLRLRAYDPGMEPWLGVRFEVIDTGIGMTRDAMKQLFQPYRQAELSTGRRFGGSGLGLAICRRLCNLMSGRIGADSIHGKGSTFWFELPFRVDEKAEPPSAPDLSAVAIVAVGFVREERTALDNLFKAIGVTEFRHADPKEAKPAIARMFVEEGETSSLAIVSALADRKTSLAIGDKVRSTGIKTILAGPHMLASTLDDETRAGYLATLFWPLNRQQMRSTIAAALGLQVARDAYAGTRQAELAWAPPSLDDAYAHNSVVLVAEDNLVNQLVIRRLLSQLGFAHEIVGDGVQALSRIAEERFAMLLTDLHMPELDGFGLTTAIREREQGSEDHLPIVALTADSVIGMEQSCRDAGIDGYLVKPIDIAALAAVLHRYVPQGLAIRRRADSEIDAPVEPTADLPAKVALTPAEPLAQNEPALPDIDPQIFDLSEVSRTFGGLNEAALSLIHLFADQVPGMVDGVLTALSDDDQTKALAAAHALKGSALTLGANGLGLLAGDIEDMLREGELDTANELATLLPAARDRFFALLPSLNSQEMAYDQQ